jgi:DNA-binding LacI/PurR family transcriptional regulator
MPQSSTGRKSTLADVAKLAGVSTTAVSAAMNSGHGKTIRVSPETISRIREAAEELGYHANLTARSLATGRTGFIGFMLSSSVSRGWLNPYFASYLQGAETECRRLGYGLAVTCAPISEAGKFILSDILSQRRIDALIVAGELDAAVYRELKSSRIPFVVLNAMYTPGIPVINEPRGLTCIIDYALSKGHRRIGITRDRMTPLLPLDFKETLARAAENGAQIEIITPAPSFHPNWEPGFGLGHHLFERWSSMPEPSRPTLLMSGDILVEFHTELMKAGLKCPDDISLIGDNDYNLFNTPIPFTRLKIDNAKIGADAVETLSAAIKRGALPNAGVCAAMRYKMEIVEGGTVR